MASARLLAAGLSACSGALFAAPTEGRVPVASATTGRIALLDCVDGRERATAQLDAPLSAPPLVDAGSETVYTATQDGVVRAFALPTLAPGARTDPGFVATTLAAAPGANGLLLVGGDAAGTLSARDPVTLAEIQRYPEAGAVAAIVTTPPRQRFAVAFRDQPVAWEIAWNADAPPVLAGYVHDYRSNEAVPLPGRLTPRAFRLPTPTATLVAGPAPFELGRIDDGGRFGIVNLDVQREIERPRLSMSAIAPTAAAWRTPAARGWAIAEAGSRTVRIVESERWNEAAMLRLEGAVLTAAGARPPGPVVLIAHRTPLGIAVTKVAAQAEGAVHTVWRMEAPIAMPVRFVDGSSGCLALLDGADRWLAGFDASSGDRLDADAGAVGAEAIRAARGR